MLPEAVRETIDRVHRRSCRRRHRRRRPDATLDEVDADRQIPNAAPIDAPNGITPEKPPIEPGFENDRSRRRRIGDRRHRARRRTAAARRRRRRRTRARRRHDSRSRRRFATSQPVYPPIAQAARVQGIVIIEATIGADGRVVNARILRSVPLLDQAALDAVRQWQYTPTLLNGVPVPVIMTVTVKFTLSR